MNIKLIKLLVFVCIALSLIVAGEWLYASHARHRLLASINEAKPESYQADQLPGIDLNKQPEESYADLVARPLFLKGRRPVNEPTPEAAQAAAGKPDSFDWQLDGVYSSKKTVSALFSRAKAKAPLAKDNYRRMRVGDELDGWKLSEINNDGVLFKQGGDEKQLLLRKPKSKAVAPAAPAVSPFAAAIANAKPPQQPPPPPSPFSTMPIPVPNPATGTTANTSEDAQ
ncbi:MAG: hypothetical protein ACNA7G_03025 [Methylobacter sp.]